MYYCFVAAAVTVVVWEDSVIESDFALGSIAVHNMINDHRRMDFFMCKWWPMRLSVGVEWTLRFAAPGVKNTSHIIHLHLHPPLSVPSITVSSLKQILRETEGLLSQWRVNKRERLFDWLEDSSRCFKWVALLCCPLTFDPQRPEPPEAENWSVAKQLPIATRGYISRRSAAPHKHFNLNILINDALMS